MPFGHFRITDLVEACDDPFQGFHLGLAISTFWTIQHSSADPANDEIIDKQQFPKEAAIPLIIKLSAFDPIFFDLSARMAANTLYKNQGNGGALATRIAVAGLVGQRPSVGKSRCARDVGIVFALANTCRLRLKPTERKSKKTDAPVSNSGSRLFHTVANEQGRARGMPEIKQIGQIWDKRSDILQQAGFDLDDVSLFLERFKGTT